MITLRPRGPQPFSTPEHRGPRHPVLAAGVLSLLALAGCDDPAVVRVYDAPVDVPPAAADGPVIARAAGALPPGLAWEVPAGYRDTGESNQFRTATLVGGPEADPVEVAISRVPGQSGSVEANVNRWRGQLSLPPAGGEDVAASVSVVPGGEAGIPGRVITLVNDTADPPAAQRIAWFELPAATWYVKASGTPGAIERETATLDGFFASLRPADASPSPAR